MASIQQSFNQMLMTAQFGAGLYAHSPMGKAIKAGSEAKDIAAQREKAVSPEAKKLLSEQEKSKLTQAFEYNPTAELAERLAGFDAYEGATETSKEAFKSIEDVSKSEAPKGFEQYAEAKKSYSSPSFELYGRNSELPARIQESPEFAHWLARNKRGNQSFPSYLRRLESLQNQKNAMSVRAEIMKGGKR